MLLHYLGKADEVKYVLKENLKKNISNIINGALKKN